MLFADREKLIELLEKNGSPLYVYDEQILRERCREMKGIVVE
jgi:diaminopimelate decarboxylase